MEDFDDDFGDLYADVEFQASSATNCIPWFAKSYVERMEVEGGEEDSDVTDSKKFNMVHGDSAQKLGSEANSGKDMNVDNGSDSEDDLNIVLNDEDCKNFPIASGGNARNGGVVGGGGHGEDEDDDLIVVGEGSGGSEPSSNGHGGERGNGARGAYNSQYTRYKYMRPHGAAFPSNMRGNGPVGMASYSSMLARGNRDDSPCNQHKGSNAGQVVPVRATAHSVLGQSGYCFSLPWNRTILDVNIDTFEEKPWRFPGVDITDFFNFGFNEDTWKEYCNSLEQFQQQAFMQTGIPVCGSLKINQACEAKCEYEKGFRDTAVEGNQVGLRRIISPSSTFLDSRVGQLEMPKGRAIQVEDSAGERQPSMDLRRSRTRDSDVIQITVQDPIEDASVSGKEEVHRIDSTVHAAFDNGNSDADDSSDIYCSGNASGDEPSVQSQEGNVRRLDRCSQLTTAYNPMNLDADKHENEKILVVNVHHHQKGKVYPSVGVTEGMETVNKTPRGISRNSCSGDPFMEETELSLGDHGQLSLDSSCYGSDSEASRDSVCADSERTYSPLKRPSPNSSAELLDSDTSYHKNFKSSSAKSKSGDMKLRNKGSTREEQEHCSRRGNGVAKPKIHTEDNDDASHMWDAEDLGDTDHSMVKSSRQKERKQGFERRDTEDLSYHREKEFSSCNGGEKFAGNDVRTAYRKHPYRKGNHNLRGKMDSYARKKWDEKEYYNEQRSPRVDDEERDRDWYHRGGRFSTDYLSRFTYGESRQLNSRYSSCSVEERDTWWSRKHSKLQLRKRTNHDARWLDYKHEDNFVPGKYGRPASFLERNLDLDERKLPYIGRELKNSSRRDRYGDSPPLDLDNPWSQEIEDDYRRQMDYQSLNSWFYRESYIAGGCQHDTMSPRNDVYDSRLTERYGGRRRQIFAGKVRDNGWLDSHNDGNDLEDCIVYPDDQDHLNQGRYSCRSRFLHWSEDELILRRRDDKLYVEEASISYKNSTGHERICARYGSAHDGRLSDEMQVQQQRLKMIKEGSSTYCINRSSKIINRERHEQAVLRCRDSVDLVVGEGKESYIFLVMEVVLSPSTLPSTKSPRRCSKSGSLMSNGRSGNIGQKIDKKRAALMDSNEPHMEKAVQSDIPKTASSQNNAKCLDKFPITEHNEDLDIEEGQIVTEEPNAEDSFRRRGVSQDAALTCNVKKRILGSENGSNGNKVTGGYDNERILETLAKMEKRGERFKGPIALKKEPGKSLKPEVDLIVDTDETKQQRPVRKRRWGGS